MRVLAVDDKSGWTMELRLLSPINFDRLNHSLTGVPIYYNHGRVWPSPADGVSVIWDWEGTES